MGQETLVTEQKVDGKRLVKQLRHDGFDVQGAFWLYDGDAGRWSLNLVTNERAKGAAAAYKIVLETLLKLQPIEVNPFEVVLTDSADPRAAAIRDLQTKYPLPFITNIQGQYLGGVYFDNA